MQHTVEAVHVLAYPIGKTVEVFLGGHVQLDDRRRLRQFACHPLDQRHPAEAGQDDVGALLLRDLRHRECDRGIRDHAGDQQALAIE